MEISWETKRKRDTRNTKHEEGDRGENKCIFCVNKSISPKSTWKATDEETRPSNTPALQYIPSHGIGTLQRWQPLGMVPQHHRMLKQSYTRVCLKTKQLQPPVRKGPKTFFLPLVENSLSDQYRLSTLAPRCPCGSQSKRDRQVRQREADKSRKEKK